MICCQFVDDSRRFQSGYDSISHRVGEHCGTRLIALASAVAIALPLGLLTGHTGRGDVPLTAIASAARALPSLGLLVLLTVRIGVFGSTPAMIPLVALASRRSWSPRYEGVRSVDRPPWTRPAAWAWAVQVLFQVELPFALPLILSGLRSARCRSCRPRPSPR